LLAHFCNCVINSETLQHHGLSHTDDAQEDLFVANNLALVRRPHVNDGISERLSFRPLGQPTNALQYVDIAIHMVGEIHAVSTV
jgi:hypothetical protein